jgi:PhoH-like ATPase
MTTEIAKLVIGRIGEGSELWINADTHQTDKKIFDEDNGVNKMIDKLSGNALFGHVYMPKTERSSVAELATLLDD